MKLSRLLPAEIEAEALAPKAVLPPWALEDETTSNETAFRSNNGFSRSNTAVIAAADYPPNLHPIQMRWRRWSDTTTRSN